MLAKRTVFMTLFLSIVCFLQTSVVHAQQQGQVPNDEPPSWQYDYKIVFESWTGGWGATKAAAKQHAAWNLIVQQLADYWEIVSGLPDNHVIVHVSQSDPTISEPKKIGDRWVARASVTTTIYVKIQKTGGGEKPGQVDLP